MADPTQGVNLSARAPTAPQTYRYPLTKLEKSDDYLKIIAFSYEPPGFVNQDPKSFALPTSSDVNRYDIKTALAYFILPIPDSIGEVNATNWGASTFNPIAGQAASTLQSAFKNNSNIQDAIGKAVGVFGGKASQILNSGTTQSAIEAGAIALGANVLFGNTSFDEVFSRYNGTITNSNIELLFNSVSIRPGFVFSFDLVARSKEESENIRKMIRDFKKYSAPKKSGSLSGAFLKAPEIFKVEYMNGSQSHPYLNRFKMCALTGVTVNYANGTYATYSDGAPVNITLSLSFQELAPIYSEDYNDTNVGGTGY